MPKFIVYADNYIDVITGKCRVLKEVTEEYTFEELMAKQWIPVSERLPDDMSNVLCTTHFRYLDAVGECEFMGGKFYVMTDYGDEEDVTPLVTAWMPMPIAYKPEKGVDE